MGVNEKKIIVAVDGSVPSRNALNYSLDLGNKLGAKVVALHVIQSAQKTGYWAFIDNHFEKELRAYADQIKNETRNIAFKSGSSIEIETVEGVPYEEIVKYISDKPDIMLLVMGTQGHSLTEKQFIGSTTDRVIAEIAKRKLSVPVTIVPFRGEE